jgi:V8-like Glu-specific endopeptidase
VRNQAKGASCTAFLVGPNLVASAGHCLATEAGMTSTRFVFGFTADAAGGNPVTTVPISDVYQCAAGSLQQSNPGTGANDADWSLCRLTRAAGDRPVLPIRYAPNLGVNQAVHVFGHPDGLPHKHTFSGTVKAFSSTVERFDHNLDVFGGNSGSPVLDALGVVTGIHVISPTAHYTKQSVPGGTFCAAYTVCDSANGCPNFSRAQRIDRIGNRIPLLPVGVMSVL